MAEVNTRADSIRVHLSGAASHNAEQADPDASIGNYRSSVEATMLAHEIADPIANVQVTYVAGANGTGTGSLAATGADELAWAAPGGTQGDSVTILDGQERVLESAGAPEQYIRVTRTSADSLAGTATLALTDVVNNVVGLDDVGSAEALAGRDEQRAVCLVNSSATTVTNLACWLGTLGSQRVSGGAQLPASGAGTIALAIDTLADWPASGFCRVETSAGSLREIVYYAERTVTELTVPAAGRAQLGTAAEAGAADDNIYPVPGIRIAQEAPSSQPDGHLEASSSETDIPSGLTWRTAISSAGDVVDVGTLAAGEQIGLRIRRATVAGHQATPVALHRILRSFDAP